MANRPHITSCLIAFSLFPVLLPAFFNQPREENTELLIAELPSPQAGGVAAQSVYPQIQSDDVFVFTDFMEFPDGSGRFLVSQMDGKIFLLPNDPDPSPGDVLLFLEIDDICAVAESGLNSFTFDPGYTTNGYIYVCYNVREGGACTNSALPGAN